MKRIAIGDALKASGGASAGFDWLRLGLALYIFGVHCLFSADPHEAPWVWNGAFGPVHRAALPMFFALSGFLVSGSFARNDLVSFIALRALRILPALAVEVTLSALVLGPVFTTLPLADYFGAAEFRAYFLNIVGDIHFTLPGVFPGRQINGQLWTIPFELQCYLAMVALYVVPRDSRRAVLTSLIVSATALITFLAVRDGLGKLGPVAPHLTLTFSFLFGVALRMSGDRIPLRADLFAASLGVSYLALACAPLAFLAPPAVAYATVYLGLARPPRLPFGDLSYGLYIYHGPILAAFFYLLGARATPATLAITGLPATLAFAWASWTFVEAPILGRKGRALGALARWRARLALALPARPAAEEPQG